MKFSRETSMKIRTAIKVKLAELGNDVYEELPDYIMVMVANKKSEEQMTEDLTLFLGDKTDQFTSWLHSLLTKLQSIMSESAGENRASAKQTGAPAKTPTDSGSEHSALNEDASYATSSSGSDEASTSCVHLPDETSSFENNRKTVDADSTSKTTKPATNSGSDADSSIAKEGKDAKKVHAVPKRKFESETRTVKTKVHKVDPSAASSKKVVKGSSSTQKVKTVKLKSKRTDSSTNSDSDKLDTNAKTADVSSKAGCEVSSSIKKTELPKDGESSPDNDCADPLTQDTVELEDKSKSKIIRLKRL